MVSKLLGGLVRPFVTPCVLAELKGLGKEFAGVRAARTSRPQAAGLTETCRSHPSAGQEDLLHHGL